MPSPHYTLKTSVRLLQHDDIALGPGKVRLLAAIRDTGSISGAARQMGMSYRRAWLLVETMNHCFSTALVSTSTGGRSGGGAQLTEAGEQVMKVYQDMLAEMETVARNHLDSLLQTVPLKSRQPIGNL